MDLVGQSFALGESILANRSPKQLKSLGQFLTPPVVARYLARQLSTIKDGDRILDPSIGSGVLACALIEEIIQVHRYQSAPIELWLDGYEIDSELAQAARDMLALATEQAAKYGIILHTRVYEDDFILTHISLGPLFGTLNSLKYDCIIANPPYFKLNKEDPRVRAVIAQSSGYTNIYTLFIAFSIEQLQPSARACFIVPRSFCSGTYFSDFREDFIERVVPLAVHLFESRNTVFGQRNVLQENIIITFRKPNPTEVLEKSFQVAISISRSAVGLDSLLPGRDIDETLFLGKINGSLFFRLPVSELDENILRTVDSWSGSFSKYGLKVSTGPVVAFRAKSYLTNVDDVDKGAAVPLLWMQNVQPDYIIWPVVKKNKPQGILSSAGDKLLVPLENYVLVRRFSSKEEPRRLISAPLIAQQFTTSGNLIGLENHLNYIYHKSNSLAVETAVGLSTLLNSALIDRYFRILSGNTQVNATELRALPLPPLSVITELGRKVMQSNDKSDLDTITFSVLREMGCLSLEFPTIKESRITMGKIQEAQEILKALGLPIAQQNEMAALTLLVLAQLSEDTPWSMAQRHSMRIHDMLVAMRESYDRDYAENTRETVRRQVIHQFEQAGLVLRNPDDPGLATNSPRTHYALSDLAIQTVRAYGMSDWDIAIQEFLDSKGALLEVYQKVRVQHKVPLQLDDGQSYYLSPGEHNRLQVLIVKELGPRFAPGAHLLYLGDTADKTLILDKAGFENLGIPVPQHDKLPDIVLYDKDRNWLFLIEAVTSHGPISPKRHLELEELFSCGMAEIVYITAFPDLSTFKSFLSSIAWETEVWVAEVPDHLIHFNGDSFLGPHKPKGNR